MFAILYADLKNFDHHLRPGLRRKWKVVFGQATALAQQSGSMPRHFKPPWTAERNACGYVLKDATGQVFAAHRLYKSEREGES